MESSHPNLGAPRLERIDPILEEIGVSDTAGLSEAAESIATEEWNERDAIRSAAHRELPTELLRVGVARLAKICIGNSVVLGFYLLSVLLLFPSEQRELRSTIVQLLVAGIVASLITLALTRTKRIDPRLIVDLGYVFLFVLSLLLGLLRHSEPWSEIEFTRHVPPVAIPILIFGALIPAPPKKALIVLLGAAAMDPLSLVLMRSRLTLPGAGSMALLLASPFIAALLSFAISRVVYRMSEGIVKAREVGSYRLLERLGIGGMAEVWRAEHRLLARPAAIKLIRPQVLIEHGPQDSQRLLRLFAREARATASLRSPHTILVYDFGTTREGAFYYVMELLDGIDLQTLVERFGPQPAERVAHVLRQACHSLQEAHQLAFVHRDVKPANIFTCLNASDYDFVKVLDFGLVMDRHPTSEELEDEQRLIGTPAVMAPEMVRFHSPVDARADLYALGCVAYWLLTGKRVFEAQTRHDMLVMHAHQKPLTPSARLGMRIHPELEAIVMSCLEKNPNRRPQTARELAESLSALTFEHAWSNERAGLWWQKHQLLKRTVGGASDQSTEPQAASAEPA